MRFSPPVLTE